jgi:hypothetical protein
MYRHGCLRDQREGIDDDMTDMAGALRATSDSLMHDLERLADLEAQKRLLEPGDPRLVELAEQVEAIAVRLTAASSRQRLLTRQAEALVAEDDPEAPAASIEGTPREIHVILAEWRDVERRAQEAEPGSAEAEEAARRSDELRTEYRRAHDAAGRRPDRHARGG